MARHPPFPEVLAEPKLSAQPQLLWQLVVLCPVVLGL